MNSAVNSPAKQRAPRTGRQPQPDRRVAVVYRSLRELRADPANPRVHSPRQIRQIAESIEVFGFNVPVLIDANLNVIAGHGRLKACELLGWSEVPTIVLDHLSSAQTRAFMLADNRLTEKSQWDDQLLGEQLHALSLLDLDFDLEVTGFDMGEIDFRIEQLTSTAEDQAAEQLPPLPPGPPVTCLGDTWLLGEQRVHCGSALEPSAFSTLMQGQRARAVFIDPPYNVPIAGNVSGLGTVKHGEFIMGSGEMSEAEYTSFLVKACSLHTQHSTDGALHFVCMDWRHLAELLAAGRAAHYKLENLCVWAKDTPAMGSFYRSQHELIFVFKHGHRPHRNNIRLGQYGRNRSNVWQYPGANSFSRTSEEGNLLALHATPKPVAMVADAIVDCTSRHDIVLDGFLGSGTTVIAAERTGRRCFGLELDPLFVDTIVRRWQAFTRMDARHATSGRSFKELMVEVNKNPRGGAKCGPRRRLGMPSAADSGTEEWLGDKSRLSRRKKRQAPEGA